LNTGFFVKCRRSSSQKVDGSLQIEKGPSEDKSFPLRVVWRGPWKEEGPGLRRDAFLLLGQHWLSSCFRPSPRLSYVSEGTQGGPKQDQKYPQKGSSPVAIRKLPLLQLGILRTARRE
jgi:hypothetical protein